MRHVKALSGVALVFALAAGCSAENTGGSLEEMESGEPASASMELARIDFPDGNSVRFEELDGGILVMEVGPELNPLHLMRKEGMSPLEAFRALAPGREVPPALLRAHERIYPTASQLEAEEVETTTPLTRPDDADLPMDQDLEHNGQFQQSGGSYPASLFVSGMCNFPMTAPNYIQINNSVPHIETTSNINTAYFAVASDIGIITAKACANNSCGPAIALQAGFHNSGFYAAGQRCSRSCCPLGLCGCTEVCTPRKVKFDVITGKVSTTVRFHECSSFS